jgi:hypothetical protein
MLIVTTLKLIRDTIREAMELRRQLALRYPHMRSD